MTDCPCCVRCVCGALQFDYELSKEETKKRHGDDVSSYSSFQYEEEVQCPHCDVVVRALHGAAHQLCAFAPR